MKLLDTDTCIGILKGVPKVVAEWRSCGERCSLSPMSIGELTYGAAKARNPEAERVRVGRLVDILDEVSASRKVMMRFGLVKAELEVAGTRLADADLLIAATALEHDMTLVTGNTRHFARIPGLRLENWFE